MEEEAGSSIIIVGVGFGPGELSVMGVPLGAITPGSLIAESGAGATLDRLDKNLREKGTQDRVD